MNGVVRHGLVAVCAAVLCGWAGAEFIALENGSVRVEIDTEYFAMRYVGAPGGKNLIAVHHIPERIRADGTAPLEPGGITFHLESKGRAMRAEGPGETVERGRNRIVVLSAPVDDTGLRVRLECTLAGRDSDATVRVGVQTTSQETVNTGITLRTVLAPEAILRLPKADATILDVTPEALSASLLVDMGDYWAVDPNPAAAVRSASGVVDSGSRTMTIAGGRHWLRRVTEFSANGGPSAPLVRYRRDVESRQRIVEWVFPPVDIDLWSTPSITEVWRLEPAGG